MQTGKVNWRLQKGFGTLVFYQGEGLCSQVCLTSIGRLANTTLRHIVSEKLSQQSSLNNHVNHSSLPLHDHMQSINVHHPPATNKEISSNEEIEPIPSVIPMLGALPLSLNAQENVIKHFHTFMKFMYESIFPKQWRRTLLLEIIYCGLKLICSCVLSTYAKCRDPEYGALLKLLDNYLPFVICIHNVVFKWNI